MNLAIISVNLFVMCSMMQQTFQDSVMYESFGFGADRDTIIGFTLFMAIYSSTLETPLKLFLNWMTRRNELQADTFAHTMGRGVGLREGLKTISEQNLGTVCPDPWFSWWNHTHPPVMERLNAID